MTCALCQSAVTTVFLDDVADYITGERFSIRQCSRCGLAATDPPLSGAERFYPAAYRRYGRATLRLLRWLYRRRVRRWASRFPTCGSALEIGCGDGWMLATLRDQGWRVLGSERSAEAARFAADVNGIPIVLGGLDEITDSEQFDLIILFHVLEHVEQPLDMLRRCSALLRPDGLIVVSVPSLASWQARVTGRSWFHLDVPRHRHHFSPGTLDAAMQKSGLRVVHTKWVSFEHDPYGWFQSLMNMGGIEQNLVTKFLMGMNGEGRNWSAPFLLVLAGVVLVPVSVALSIASWVYGAGAIVEKWAVKAPDPSREPGAQR